MFYKFFWYPWILRPLRYILAFKIPLFEYGVQIWTKGTLKHLTRWYESIFEPISFPVCNLVFLATRAAFLTFLALKLKNKETCELVTPNSPIDMKKWWNLGIVDSLAFVWPSRPLLAFFIFPVILDTQEDQRYAWKSNMSGITSKTLTIPKFWK